MIGRIAETKRVIRLVDAMGESDRAGTTVDVIDDLIDHHRGTSFQFTSLDAVALHKTVGRRNQRANN